ncbi:hypothetical protein SDC9_152552 [bioreactor metagenome]|uniref:Uncharacterized protein n=1 Tax=bioreactor metagenome TaxID=1076179 RepID=A0A645EVP6_9ZZZZ
MSPVSPSTSSGVPSAISARRAPTATMQGMPSWRAMIAVWLVLPPSWVTRPAITSGRSPAVSAGARSSASSTTGESGSGTPGSGSPRSSAITRSRTSFRSVVRSAIRPPIFSNFATKVSVAWTAAQSAGAPWSISLLTVRCQPLSVASAAVAASTSEACPVTIPARPDSRLPTTAAAAAKRSFSPWRPSSATSAPWVGSAGRGRTHWAGA